MPAWLSKEAQEIWAATAGLLISRDLLEELDGAVLADFCEVCAEKRRIIEYVRLKSAESLKMKPAKVGKKDRIVTFVELQMQFSQQLVRLRRHELMLRRELGLSPSSRSAIRVNPESLAVRPVATEPTAMAEDVLAPDQPRLERLQ